MFTAEVNRDILFVRHLANRVVNSPSEFEI